MLSLDLRTYGSVIYFPEVDQFSSSNFPHIDIMALGSYKNYPFITGSINNVKTEIFDYGAGNWLEADDYPFESR